MATQYVIPAEAIGPLRGKNFFERAEANPCTGCSAPCCRMLLIPHPTPSTYMDLDYIRYMVGFQSVKMILTTDGHWQVIIEQNCRLLDQKTNLCTVHGTPKKPKTCVFFNPYQCWYKRNFTTVNPPDIIRIDLEVIEIILAHVRFDDEGTITELPTYEFIRDAVEHHESELKSKPWFPVLEEDVRQREMV